ncbi:2-dehydropantoate 2-reductase [Rhodococcus erythropolis]|uniref:2-dehydropantoate 2-reductase n=1 Tax=Rhodococcus erythropolis TaxID=1833 RepID=UPI001E32D96F|nr:MULTISPECIES: 2-dehydropantoate 2-reductase [Rhodococcus erythropolis group]MCD2109411.1 2-dehydropantoate 2-reductase [Rhodococcus qingshengii]MCZ4527402.1 2-dehydropantoate 2-reductase [Rhodococcus erythropolis]
MRDSAAIIGSGAIAGVTAAWIRKAGKPTPLVCARTPFDAFTVIGDGSGTAITEKYPVNVITSPDDARVVSWVFVTVKAHDTTSVKPWLDALTGHDTVVVIMQNGIDHVDRTQPITDKGKILPALIYAGAERIAPATVHHRIGASLTVPDTTTGQAFAAYMTGGVHVTTSEDFLTESWRKLLVNIGLNPITALTLRHADVLRETHVQRTCTALLTETRTVANAVGARIADADVSNVLELYRNYPADVGSSMLYDRLAGRSLEYDLLLGAVVRAARTHNIAVPVTETLFSLTSAVNVAQLIESPAPGAV